MKGHVNEGSSCGEYGRRVFLSVSGIEEAMRVLLRYILAMDTWSPDGGLSGSLSYDDALVISGGRQDVEMPSQQQQRTRKQDCGC